MSRQGLSPFISFVIVVLLIILFGFLFSMVSGCAAVRPPKVAVYDGSVFPAKTCVLKRRKQ